MTPLELLAAAANGTPAPRIPVFCNLLDQGARELGLPQKEYYARGEQVAEAQLKMLARYGHDNVWSLSYVGVEAELLGCREILFADNGVPNVADFVIKSLDDIARLEIPTDITAHPASQRTAACLEILRGEVGATHPICAYITASTTLPAILMGMEQWMELLTMGPFDLRDELLRKCSDFCSRELAAYRAAGANVLVYSTPFGSTYFVGERRFRELSLPWMQRDLAPGGIAGIVYYCGMAPFNNVIEPVLEKLGIGSYYISPLADLGEAKAIIGNRALTCGVIDDIKMIHWTPQQTRDEVQRICAVGKRGGHFLFGTGVMPQAIPEANIRAMIDAAFEFGQLP
jgi:uroporphyrinogen-III decarboxylase